MQGLGFRVQGVKQTGSHNTVSVQCILWDTTKKNNADVLRHPGLLHHAPMGPMVFRLQCKRLLEEGLEEVLPINRSGEGHMPLFLQLYKKGFSN